MEHAYAAVAVMVMAAAFASAAVLHAHESAQHAGQGAGPAPHLVDTRVGLSGSSPSLVSLTVANAGRAAVVSANATACGASGLLGRAAGDGNWSLRPGSAAAVSWVAPCAAGPAVVRVEYETDGGGSIVHLRKACAGGAQRCGQWGAGGGPGGPPGGGGGQGGGGQGGGGDSPPAQAPPAQAPPAPAIASCTVSGMAVRVCVGGGGGGGSAASYEVSRTISPGLAAYAAVATLAAAEGGGGGGAQACHADTAPAGSASAAYRATALANGAKSEPSRTARAVFASQACYVDTPGGERIGSPSGPPAPQPASQSDYRISMYTGVFSTPRTVQAHFGPDRYVVERQPDGSWSRLGFAPSHPQALLSGYLPAERVAGGEGGTDVRYVRADLLRHLDAFWGARR